MYGKFFDPLSLFLFFFPPNFLLLSSMWHSWWFFSSVNIFSWLLETLLLLVFFPILSLLPFYFICCLTSKHLSVFEFCSALPFLSPHISSIYKRMTPSYVSSVQKFSLVTDSLTLVDKYTSPLHVNPDAPSSSTIPRSKPSLSQCLALPSIQLRKLKS